MWEDCEKEAPLWSLDEGIILNRTTNRKEPTIGAYGLIEGMPTALHFERRIYDDIVTQDIGDSVDEMEKVKRRFDNSQNLKTLTTGLHRVVGTYYHHNDPLVYIKGKQTFDGVPRYAVRFKPATHNGEANGRPVLMSQDRWMI